MSVLASEIKNDPLGRGYSGMTDAQIAADINTAYRSRTVETVRSSQIYEAIVPSEFQALTDTQKNYVRDILGLGDGIKVTAGSQARAVMLQVFGVGTTTRTNLAALASQSITRGQELGVGTISEEQIKRLRIDGEIS